MKDNPSTVRAAIVSAALAGIAWWQFMPPTKAPLPLVAVDLLQSPGTAEGKLDEAVASEEFRLLDRELEGLRRRVVLSLPDANLLEPAGRAQADFEAKYERNDRHLARIIRLTPAATEVSQLIRNSEINPADAYLPPGVIDILEELLAVHKSRVVLVDRALGASSLLLTQNLASAGGVIPLDGARRHLSQEARVGLRQKAEVIAEENGIDLGLALVSIEAKAVAKAIRADTTFHHDGAVYFAPEGSVRPGLTAHHELRAFLIYEMMEDISGLFDHAGAFGASGPGALLQSFSDASEHFTRPHSHNS